MKKTVIVGVILVAGFFFFDGADRVYLSLMKMELKREFPELSSIRSVKTESDFIQHNETYVDVFLGKMESGGNYDSYITYIKTKLQNLTENGWRMSSNEGYVDIESAFQDIESKNCLDITAYTLSLEKPKKILLFHKVNYFIEARIFSPCLFKSGYEYDKERNENHSYFHGRLQILD